MSVVHGINAAYYIPGGHRINTVSITVAGSGNGMIYDAFNTNDTSTMALAVPDTLGVIQFSGSGGLSVNNGLLIVPGTGQTVSVEYDLQFSYVRV